MIFTYQNRATSLYNKTNTKEKTNYIVADYKAPPSNIQANRSVYENTYIPNTNPPKFTKKLVTPQRNPIKHYRRELTRDFLNNPSSRQIINNINMPGKIIVANKEDSKNCNSLFKDEIYPNSPPPIIDCFGYQSLDPPYVWKYSSCSKANNVTKSANTNMSQDYCPSIKNIREKRSQTYEKNKALGIQNYIKNAGECNNYNNSLITNKKLITNGTTSISTYKQQYINQLDNNICTNNRNNPNNINNPNNCYNNRFPNLTHKKSICN